MDWLELENERQWVVELESPSVISSYLRCSSLTYNLFTLGSKTCLVLLLLWGLSQFRMLTLVTSGYVLELPSFTTARKCLGEPCFPWKHWQNSRCFQWEQNWAWTQTMQGRVPGVVPLTACVGWRGRLAQLLFLVEQRRLCVSGMHFWATSIKYSKHYIAWESPSAAAAKYASAGFLALSSSLSFVLPFWPLRIFLPSIGGCTIFSSELRTDILSSHICPRLGKATLRCTSQLN